MRIGLVLGAGGVVGASWLMGALEALEEETGWRPGDAEYVVGTSAGSVIGALSAGGISPAYMSAYAAGRPLDAFPEVQELVDEVEGLAEALEHRETGTDYRLHWGLPPIGPGSWRMAVSTLRNPLRYSPGVVMSGWLPRGFVSTESIRRIVEVFVPVDWPEHPNLWIVACDYASGRRVVFGREDSPPAVIGDAVTASCAIPGFYHPVAISGRRYVDGGVCSTSNLDLVAGKDLDLVICLNPTSSLAPVVSRSPADWFAAGMRLASGRRLAHEIRKVRASGTDVLVLQPNADDLSVMGPNLMSRGRRAEVIEQAVRSTGIELRRLRIEGRVRLPKGPAKREGIKVPPQARRKRAA
jgi:NTE family protein